MQINKIQTEIYFKIIIITIKEIRNSKEIPCLIIKLMDKTQIFSITWQEKVKYINSKINIILKTAKMAITIS